MYIDEKLNNNTQPLDALKNQFCVELSRWFFWILALSVRVVVGVFLYFFNCFFSSVEILTPGSIVISHCKKRAKCTSPQEIFLNNTDKWL